MWSFWHRFPLDVQKKFILSVIIIIVRSSPLIIISLRGARRGLGVLLDLQKGNLQTTVFLFWTPDLFVNENMSYISSIISSSIVIVNHLLTHSIQQSIDQSSPSITSLINQLLSSITSSIITASASSIVTVIINRHRRRHRRPMSFLKHPCSRHSAPFSLGPCVGVRGLQHPKASGSCGSKLDVSADRLGLPWPPSQSRRSVGRPARRS